MLYPILTKTRNLIDLSGIWKFKLDDGKGLENKWQNNKLCGKIHNLPVPSSFNDLIEDIEVREHVGWVWYEKEFEIPNFLFKDERIVLRFGSATHKAVVFLNGVEIIQNKGGFLPFEIELKKELLKDKNRLTVAINNELDLTTLPVGSVKEIKNLGVGMETNSSPTIKRHNSYCVDFFNYSGIHRPVKIYTTPKNYIEDIILTPEIENDNGIINYEIKSSELNQKIIVTVYDKEGNEVEKSFGSKNSIMIKNAKFWEPGNGYMYELKVELYDENNLLDVYYEKTGIRTVEVVGDKFLINKKPFYFKGFGKHEDSLNNGRGLNEVINVKDFSLMKWIGANSFRTSHYPYSEEIMRLADEEGIVVIDEVPAVGLHINFMNTFMGIKSSKSTWEILNTKEQHEKDIKELIARDKNHPSVVMWCVANETALEEKGSYNYFKPLIDLARKLDSQNRPITLVSHISYPLNTEESHKVCSELDVLCFNRYYGWYWETGEILNIKSAIGEELKLWWDHHKKPMMYTEYGADTINGLKETTPVIYSEDYQKIYYESHGEIFDQCPHFIGEQVWNFADFATRVDNIMRVGGNKKGIFTRDRKPKMVAYALKNRWSNIPNFYYKK
ncbi:MAG: beta-glucuronidase [Fusobacteriaceae bacterium]